MNNDVTPVMHKFAREINLDEAKMVSGGDTTGSTSSSGFIETLDESGTGPDTVNGKPGTGRAASWTETYG